jgi:MraZ protein
MGEYQHNIDSKGRLAIPAKFREGLGETFIATRGLDNCLFVYPKEEWLQLESKLKALPFTQANARAFVRFLFSGATELSIDKQGRVVIPNHLREYAKLEKETVVIGVSNRVEIWAHETWASYSEQAELSYEDIAETIADLDL